MIMTNIPIDAARSVLGQVSLVLLQAANRSFAHIAKVCRPPSQLPTVSPGRTQYCHKYHPHSAIPLLLGKNIQPGLLMLRVACQPMHLQMSQLQNILHIQFVAVSVISHVRVLFDR